MQGPEIGTPGDEPFKSLRVDLTLEACEIECFKGGKGVGEALQPVGPTVFYFAFLQVQFPQLPVSLREQVAYINSVNNMFLTDHDTMKK